MSKTLSNSPNPENILNALQQASSPLSINELASKTNVIARNLLNPILKQMMKDGTIAQTEDSPPKFKLVGEGGFSLTSKASPSKAKTKPTDNVVHMSPKNSRPAKTEAAPASKASQESTKVSAAAEGQKQITRDSVIQLLQKEPQQIAQLEMQPGVTDILSNLHGEGLIIQEKLLGSEAVWLSPKGEELYAKLLADGVLSTEVAMETPAPAAAQVAGETKPEAAVKPAAKAAGAKAGTETESKRPIGRPKGSTNKKAAGEATPAKAKAAAPKSTTAAEPAKDAAPAKTNAAVAAKPAAPAPAPAAQAPTHDDGAGLAGLSGQLMGLLEAAAKNAVEAQVKAQSQRDQRNAKIAEDMSALSDMMIEMGNRLKSLSENINAE